MGAAVPARLAKQWYTAQGRAVEGAAAGAIAQVAALGRAGNDGDDVGAAVPARLAQQWYTTHTPRGQA